MATPEQVQNIYQEAGQQTTAAAQGFSDMLQHLLAQTSGNANELLAQIGNPGSLPAEYQPLSDVLYGYSGYIPGSSLIEEGAGWAAAAGAMPGIYDAQSAQRAAEDDRQFRQEMAARMASMSGGGGGGGGGSDDGLTAYQAESLARRDAEFAFEQEKYFAGLDQDAYEAEQEQAQREADAQIQAAIIMLAIDPDNKKAYNMLMGAVAAGGDAGNAASMLGGAREDAADDANDRNERIRDRRDALRALIGSTFNSLEQGLSKQEATSRIMSAIRTEYPNLAGMKAGKVRSIIRQHVNGSWADYRAGAPSGGGGGGGADSRKWFRRDSFYNQMDGVYNKYLGGLSQPENDDPFGSGTSEPTPTYQDAFNRIYQTMHQKYGAGKEKRWQGGVLDRNVRKRINGFLRSQGLTPPAPRSSGSDPRLGLPPAQQGGLAGRRSQPGPTAAARARAAAIRRKAARDRTEAQKRFLRNYRAKYGRA